MKANNGLSNLLKGLQARGYIKKEAGSWIYSENGNQGEFDLKDTREDCAGRAQK